MCSPPRSVRHIWVVSSLETIRGEEKFLSSLGKRDLQPYAFVSSKIDYIFSSPGPKALGELIV